MAALIAAVLLWVGSAWADPVEEAQRAELERARAEIAGQVQLSAYDLVDELVYKLAKEPVFDKPTPVVLAGVSVPVGLGTGLQSLMENHIAAVLAENPAAHVQLAHCPRCTAMVVRSGPEGTVVSRGLDDPDVLEEVGATTGQHALFIDVEAEGAFLVLRARITRLTPALPVVWSHTISTSSGSPALLRSSSDLKSAADARREYLDALRSRGPISVPLRFGVRSYAQPRGFRAGVPPPPFLWLQSGIEMAATDARAWTGSVLVGFSFIPQAYQGLMGQGRVHRLLTGRARSITRPDLYAFAGASVITVWGPATAPFQNRKVTSAELLLIPDETGLVSPQHSFGGLQLGLDLRIGNRMGASTFLETLPGLAKSRNIGDHLRTLGFGWQCWGTEVTFWF